VLFDHFCIFRVIMADMFGKGPRKGILGATSMFQSSNRKGVMVTAAGTGINLALGVLYAWSIFKVAISQSIVAGGAGAFHWDPATLNDPYATCCFVFACAMILAGKCQDTYGPRITAMIGGGLVGAGFIWVSQTTDYISWLLGFGVLVGTGIAFGYSPSTPAAIKWYPPQKVGRITGIVVAGFGLASVYIAPLTKYLLGIGGLQSAMLILGIAFLIVVCGLSLMLVNPPDGYVPAGKVERRDASQHNSKKRALFKDKEVRPVQVLKTPAFWLLWVIYFIGAGAGLMVVGNIAGMAKSSLGENAFIAVALLAVGNAMGRVAAGVLSDKIGRKKTLGFIFVFQAVLMFVAISVTGNVGDAAANPFLLVFLTTLIGFNYGANLTVFPSFAKDMWGMKNFGMNYGLLFTAWGVGGLVMSRVSQYLVVSSGSFRISLICASILLLAGTGFIALVRDEKDELRRLLAKTKSKPMLPADAAAS
jgi:MFS transporter, OFA family, oxalate/formate antiporter